MRLSEAILSSSEELAYRSEGDRGFLTSWRHRMSTVRGLAEWFQSNNRKVTAIQTDPDTDTHTDWEPLAPIPDPDKPSALARLRRKQP